MKKGVLYLFLFFIVFAGALKLSAQCNVAVNITPGMLNPVCKGQQVQFTLSPAISLNSFSFLFVSGGDTIAGNTPFSATFTADTTIVVGMINTDTSCVQAPDTTYNSYFVEVSEFQTQLIPITTECGQESIDVTFNTEGGLPDYSYEMEGVGMGNILSDVPVGTYNLFVTDANNCMDTTEVLVESIVCPELVLEPAITPNGDGKNDALVIRHIQNYPENKVYIFDRWGQRVFYKKNYKNIEGEMWDAKYLNSDLPVSAYFYVIELIFENKENKVIKGPISVIR